MPLVQKHRFDLLDGIRGLAAIAVMVYHFTSHNDLHWFGGAWVAVDLFFILSGFVIAHSYGAKLLAGMQFRQFFLIRLVRLGPLYFLGLSLGFVAALISMLAGQFGDIRPIQLGTAAMLGLAWMPYPNSLAWPFGDDALVGMVFPLNGPAWSLFFEAFVNVAFFFYVYRFKRLCGLLWIAIAVAIFLAATLVLHQTNPGWGKGNFIYGFPRVTAEFFAGVLIYQAGFHRRAARPKLMIVVGAAIALLLFSAEGALANSLTLIPLSVILASAIKIESQSLKHACAALGNLSYPLYIVHIPMYQLLWKIPFVPTLNPVVQTAVISSVCVLLAWMLIPFDERLRKILNSRVVFVRQLQAI
ncbi:MAG: acyltransferase [Oxalobacteraceae bacterium]|nr:MAG: acyltransferase [Oxalobacteraceae bacterium]